MIEFRKWWVIAALVMLASCALHEDIGEITYEDPTESDAANNQVDMPVDPDMAVDMTVADMSDMSVVDMALDMQTDAGDTGVDMAPDLAPDMPITGMTCPGADTTPLDADCDVIEQSGCPPETACAVTVIQTNPEVLFGLRCLSTDQTWSQMDGEACGAARCVPGLFCVNTVSTCFKYCRLADGDGCTPDEFCAPINDATSEIGVCRASCD